MKVSELIELLKTYPQDLQVAHEMYSEQLLLEDKDLSVKELCQARPDGWIEHKRPDKPTQTYLVFAGN
jgi:hypothetical protein